MTDDRPARRYAAATVVAATGFGLHLFLDPYGWSRRFGWRREPETDVGLYFGRCLGALALATARQGVHAARDPERSRSYYVFAESGGWLLAAAHLRGLVERRQPPIEHAEIVFWAAWAIGARRYAPAGR
ncbi:MAG: hypothetical protein M3320_02610 [Actinomycetota bacterium]|nr:hypothetical protein [Actinomycetota bacterium]MDQ5807544.1 hypothetical protein [Actinomycetota bacterium]